MVKLSQRRWMNTDLYLGWFTFYINSIPLALSVLLIMDSHTSHINPVVISLDKANFVLLLTFPSHAAHALQPSHVSVYLSISLSVCVSICVIYLYGCLLDIGRFFSFLILYTVGSTPWTGDQPVARPLPTHRTTQTE
jgi:hypothetical protein